MIHSSHQKVKKKGTRNEFDEKAIVDFDVNGALAASHTGHGTDMGFASGLLNMELDALDVQVRAVKRRLARISLPEPSLVLEVDDVLVLLGTPDQLAAVELMLLEESDPAGKRGF